MKRQSILLLVTVILLGWIFDYLFWLKSLGINFTIFLTLCLIVELILLRTSGVKPAPKSLWLLLPFAFFIIITCLRREPLTLGLARLFSLVCLGLLTVTYAGGKWTHYSLVDYARQFLQLMVGIFVRPIAFFRQWKGDIQSAGELIKTPTFKAVLRGLLIALPVVIFFAILLTSADAVFNQKMQDFFDRFTTERWLEYILRLIIILVVAYILLGIYLYAAAPDREETLAGANGPVVKRFLGFTETAIVLSSVTVLFLVFVIIQFQYFFGGRENIGVQGYTYSEYARSGFSELIWVAFFSLVMILGFSTITRREKSWQVKAYSGLSIALAALVIVILVSAYQRLVLAIDWHGFSRLRLYPSIFLVWLGLLFVTVIVLEIIRREHCFAFAALMAGFGFAASLTILNVDATIVHHNVDRAVAGKHFNVNHLTSLSSDAVPALYQEYLDPTLPQEIHEGIGAALLCFVHTDLFTYYPVLDWRASNASEWWGIADLDEVDDQLQGYRINTVSWPYSVETPGYELYQCSAHWK